MPLDDFTRGYLETALDETDEITSNQIDEEDIDLASMEAIKLDCAKFQTENAADLEFAELDGFRAGVLFWRSRNRSGSGFFDEYSQLESPDYCIAHEQAMISRDFSIRDNLKTTVNDPYHACQRLSDASKKFGETYLIEGVDGKIYI